MRLAVFQVPYDAGHWGLRMGRGPLHLVERGLVRELEAQGHDVDLQPVQLPEGFFRTEAGSAAEIQRRLARAAGQALGEGRLPIVLAGNCNATLGVIAGSAALAASSPGSTGLLWLDAHADFNTAETSASGFFDGMALAMITGGAWQALAATVPGFQPVAERDVILVGARDLDAAEEERLSRSEVVHIDAAGVPGELAPALDRLAQRVSKVHLHIDLDVLDPLDPDTGRANEFAVPGGLRLSQAEALIAAAGRSLEIASATFSAYDPDQDPDDRIVRAVRVLLAAIIEAVSTGPLTAP
jgi:arginase